MDPLAALRLPEGLSLYDPEAADGYGIPTDGDPVPLMVLSYGQGEGLLLERVRRLVEGCLRGRHGLPEAWTLRAGKGRVEGGVVTGGAGSLDADFEMHVLDGSGKAQGELLVYRLDVEAGMMTAAWFLVS